MDNGLSFDTVFGRLRIDRHPAYGVGYPLTGRRSLDFMGHMVMRCMAMLIGLLVHSHLPILRSNAPTAENDRR